MPSRTSSSKSSSLHRPLVANASFDTACNYEDEIRLCPHARIRIGPSDPKPKAQTLTPTYEQQRLIVELGAVRAGGRDDLLRDLRQRAVGQAAEDRLYRVHAELLVLAVEDFGQAIGNQRKQVPTIALECGGREAVIGEHPDRDLRRREFLDLTWV